MSNTNSVKLVAVVVGSTLFLDQFTKLLVKSNMALGDQLQLVGGWACIFFTENPGMAFGLQFGGEYGKLILSLLRLLVVLLISILIVILIRKNAQKKVIFALSLILAGALGNIIDSSIYGLLFSDSLGKVATFLPEGGGYAGFLQGNVVDMFYFPFIHTRYPEWVPCFSGEELIIFRSIFNIADIAVCVGVIYLFFIRKTLKATLKNQFVKLN